mmetsp:Transcript_1770/g.6825  ORF Transcript_1770/g.6825 Transcript_1770/m.6825 type:complete len:227 (+) Transcript_1770:1055-1735(+)
MRRRQRVPPDAALVLRSFVARLAAEGSRHERRQRELLADAELGVHVLRERALREVETAFAFFAEPRDRGMRRDRPPDDRRARPVVPADEGDAAILLEERLPLARTEVEPLLRGIDEELRAVPVVRPRRRETQSAQSARDDEQRFFQVGALLLLGLLGGVCRCRFVRGLQFLLLLLLASLLRRTAFLLRLAARGRRLIGGPVVGLVDGRAHRRTLLRWGRGVRNGVV